MLTIAAYSMHDKEVRGLISKWLERTQPGGVTQTRNRLMHIRLPHTCGSRCRTPLQNVRNASLILLTWRGSATWRHGGAKALGHGEIEIRDDRMKRHMLFRASQTYTEACYRVTRKEDEG